MSAVHVVILAAGKGSRMGALGEGVPKWLLEVGPRTIADRQLRAIEDAGDAVASTTVVTGHARDRVEQFLDGRPGVECVYNPEYASLNNWFSVLIALRAIDDGSAPVVVLNSDLFASAEWISRFVADAADTVDEALIAVDAQRRLTDESMKVAAGGSQHAYLTAIGKAEVADAVGEYVGMLMAGGESLAEFRATLESFEGREEHKDEWYERAVGLTAAGGSRWRLWTTPDSNWVEIDDDADHALAVRLDAA